MNQEDIFRLLLIVLLLANRQLASNDGEDEDDGDDEDFSYTSINNLLIFAMLTQLFDGTSCSEHKNTTF